MVAKRKYSGSWKIQERLYRVAESPIPFVE